MRPAVRPGTVYLVGAGPGDPGLLTVRALDLVRQADVVLHDHLVSAEILAECAPRARVISVGKVGHGPQTDQTAIERQLIAFARDGCRVVRLKGGDPLLFGRGSEEAAALRAAHVPFEIVPGVSSAHGGAGLCRDSADGARPGRIGRDHDRPLRRIGRVAADDPDRRHDLSC